MFDKKNKIRMEDHSLNLEGVYPDYSSFEQYIEPLKTFLSLNNDLVYIRDLHRNTYPFISSPPTFYTGYTADELMAMGNKLLTTLIGEADRSFLMEFEERYFAFINNLPPERRKHVVVNISHQFMLKNKSFLPATFEVTPFLFDADFNIWMLIGKITLSTKNFKFGALIDMKDTGEKYFYDLKKKKIIQKECVMLTNKEKHILIYSARGYLEKEIAMDLNVSINTIKTHKKNMMKKLSANNVSEAFINATNQKLI